MYSATDGVNTVNKTLALQITDTNDETPVITVNSQMSIPEELPVGTGVARGYVVSDRDDGDKITYSLEGKRKKIVLQLLKS